MTRVNVIHPSQLSRQHLVAEYREISRIPALAYAAYRRGEQIADHPREYRLGKGHVRFFYSRLGYVTKRYASLVREMLKRGYTVSFPQMAVSTDLPESWYRDYRPTKEALEVNRKRIEEKTNV